MNPTEVFKLVKERQALRRWGWFEEADNIRALLEEQGWFLNDTRLGTRVKQGAFSDFRGEWVLIRSNK